MLSYHIPHFDVWLWWEDTLTDCAGDLNKEVVMFKENLFCTKISTVTSWDCGKHFQSWMVKRFPPKYFAILHTLTSPELFVTPRGQEWSVYNSWLHAEHALQIIWFVWLHWHYVSGPILVQCVYGAILSQDTLDLNLLLTWLLYCIWKRLLWKIFCSTPSSSAEIEVGCLFKALYGLSSILHLFVTITEEEG